MKTTKNQSPTATQFLIERAQALGLSATAIENSVGHHRRYHSLGSTSVPQKIVEIDGKRFSVGGAKQYLTARERGAEE